MNLCSNVISEITQTKLEEALLKVFRSDKEKSRNWLRHQLEVRGVDSRFAKIIAKRKAASEDLSKLDPRNINQFIYSLVEEFKEAGFDEETALANPGRLRELKRLELPIHINTIKRNPQTLLKRKQELERLGLPVNVTNLCLNRKSIAEKAKRLKRTSPLKPL